MGTRNLPKRFVIGTTTVNGHESTKSATTVISISTVKGTLSVFVDPEGNAEVFGPDGALTAKAQRKRSPVKVSL